MIVFFGLALGWLLASFPLVDSEMQHGDAATRILSSSTIYQADRYTGRLRTELDKLDTLNKKIEAEHDTWVDSASEEDVSRMTNAKKALKQHCDDTLSKPLILNEEEGQQISAADVISQRNPFALGRREVLKIDVGFQSNESWTAKKSLCEIALSTAYAAYKTLIFYVKAADLRAVPEDGNCTEAAITEVYVLLDINETMGTVIEGLKATLVEYAKAFDSYSTGKLRLGLGTFTDTPTSDYKDLSPYKNVLGLTSDLTEVQSALNSLAAVPTGGLSQSSSLQALAESFKDSNVRWSNYALRYVFLISNRPPRPMDKKLFREAKGENTRFLVIENGALEVTWQGKKGMDIESKTFADYGSRSSFIGNQDEFKVSRAIFFALRMNWCINTPSAMVDSGLGLVSDIMGPQLYIDPPTSVTPATLPTTTK